MASPQWSLVAFTVLAQAAVGMTLVTAAMVAGGAPLGRSFRRALAVKLGLTAAALVASFLHLGNVTRAVYAVSHWHNSWLSREIALASIFLALLVVTLVLAGRDHSSERPLRALLAATVLVGVALVTAMARIYMVPIAPSWHAPSTPIAFAVTTLLLGASAMLVVVTPEGATRLDAAQLQRLVGWLVGAIFAVLLVKAGAAALLHPRPAGDHVAFPVVASFGLWRVLVWAAVASGVAALAAWLAAWRKGQPSRAGALVALAAFFAAELVERALFYASYVRLGV